MDSEPLTSSSPDICPSCRTHRGIKLYDGSIGKCEFCKNFTPRNI